MTCAQIRAATTFALGSTTITCAKKVCSAVYSSLQEPKFMSPALHEQRARVESSLKTVMFGSVPTAVPKSAFKERDLKALHKLEEELTAALMRKCPGCRKPFVRTEGCPEVRAGGGANPVRALLTCLHFYFHTLCDNTRCCALRAASAFAVSLIVRAVQHS